MIIHVVIHPSAQQKALFFWRFPVSSIETVQKRPLVNPECAENSINFLLPFVILAERKILWKLV